MYCSSFSYTKGTKLKDKLATCQHPSTLRLGPILEDKPNAVITDNSTEFAAGQLLLKVRRKHGEVQKNPNNLAAPFLCVINTEPWFHTQFMLTQ